MYLQACPQALQHPEQTPCAYPSQRCAPKQSAAHTAVTPVGPMLPGLQLPDQAPVPALQGLLMMALPRGPPPAAPARRGCQCLLQGAERTAAAATLAGRPATVEGLGRRLLLMPAPPVGQKTCSGYLSMGSITEAEWDFNMQCDQRCLVLVHCLVRQRHLGICQ